MKAAVWTDERIERLRRLWASGMSTREIGVELGVTKDAVIGAAHRLELEKRRMNAANAAGAAILRRVRTTASWRPAARGWVTVEMDGDIPDVTHLCGLIELRSCMCKWPVSGSGEHTIFCGAPTGEIAQSYCQEHARRSRNA
jgi:GcrA cell cycle regulator